MSEKQVETRAALEHAWHAAKASESEAFDELAALERQVKHIERKLEDHQRRLRIFRGDDARLRAKMLDSVELASFDPGETEQECLRLWRVLRDKTAECKAAAEKLEKAKKSEQEAFDSLQNHDHKAAVQKAIPLMVELYWAWRAERVARGAVSDRSGVRVGRLPILCLENHGAYDIKEGQSSLCHMIRQAVRLGYLTGEEDFLEGVAWREDAVTVARLAANPLADQGLPALKEPAGPPATSIIALR